MSDIKNYLLSTKPAKLPLSDADGNETGDYLGVVSTDAPKVARARCAYSCKAIELQRELEAIALRADDKGIIADEDIKRQTEIVSFETKENQVEFAINLIDGSSFGAVSDDDMRELLSEGNIALAVIALANDEDRNKKK